MSDLEDAWVVFNQARISYEKASEAHTQAWRDFEKAGEALRHAGEEHLRTMEPVRVEP